MAWNKVIQLDSGIDVGFWRVEKMFFVVDQGTLEISYQGFKDEQAFNDGKAAIVSRSVNVEASGNPGLSIAVVGYCQSVVLAQPEFEGAEAL